MPDAPIRFHESKKSVLTKHSLTGGGELPVTLSLLGDEDPLYGQKYYGTNVDGIRGWYDFPILGGGGSSTFIGLTDTPASYTGQSLKALRVNAGETGIEFYVPSVVVPAALTKTDDTNVTLSLGGTPTTALLQATSLTLGWTGTLSLSRGGFGKAMVDPNANRLLIWDDTDNDFEFVTLGTGLTYTHASHTLSVSTSTIVSNLTFGLKKTSGVPVGKLPGYWTCPFAGTITAWNITVDAGTITLKVWKIASGTVKPTSINSINTSGVSLSSGTSIHGISLTDFITTSVAVGDIFAIEVTAASGVVDLGGSIEITRT